MPSDRKMTPEYAKLSFLAGNIFGRVDGFLKEHYFYNKIRAHLWDLSEDLINAWKKEALDKGVPAELLEPAPEAIELVNDPEWIKEAIGFQDASDRAREKGNEEETIN